MHEALELLLADGVIDEVVARLKSGKEADVYVVSHAGRLVAAKIYKERNQRNFKNNAGYTEGRAVRNSRTARAIAKGSKFGQASAEDAWKATEADALGKLHAAGVRVPTPVMFYEGVLLMDLVTDGAGQPAARIVDALLDAASAAALYKDLRQQVVKMLCCDIIHGDLSAYNILLSDNGPTIIDFPQVVAAAANSQAEFYFRRDLDNLRLFFASYDRGLLQREGDSSEIWRAYTRRELHPEFEPSGRGVPGGGRNAHPRGPRQPSHSREFQELVRDVAPPPAVEEDEFALLRQGGGERPKVALAKREPQGRGPRRGPGGGRGGGGFGGGRPSGPPRAAGGGGRPQGAPRGQPAAAHGGAQASGAPRGHPAAAQGGGRGAQAGSSSQAGAASHGGRAQAPHTGGRPQPGAATQGGHRGAQGQAPHAGGRPHPGAAPQGGPRAQDEARSPHGHPQRHGRRDAQGAQGAGHAPPHAASMHPAAQSPTGAPSSRHSERAHNHPPRHPRAEGGPGGDAARGSGRPQGSHPGGHGRQGPAHHGSRGDRPHGQSRGPQRPGANGRGPAVSYVARSAAPSGKPSDEG